MKELQTKPTKVDNLTGQIILWCKNWYPALTLDDVINHVCANPAGTKTGFRHKLAMLADAADALRIPNRILTEYLCVSAWEETGRLTTYHVSESDRGQTLMILRAYYKAIRDATVQDVVELPDKVIQWDPP